ncbi:hypothetical protein BDV34DRAFT_219337 [Aspergillus parasiticus]|uniref:Uncharacterized protein n=1 Tax=Aspergillus parasiticus TaxID=5067 RepID=A0A5N6E5R6_ASPPA|nr:hypothetical protein BDV34DRAFT_219337 [Aspergillus parasiticus]
MPLPAPEERCPIPVYLRATLSDYDLALGDLNQNEALIRARVKTVLDAYHPQRRALGQFLREYRSLVSQNDEDGSQGVFDTVFEYYAPRRSVSTEALILNELSVLAVVSSSPRAALPIETPSTPTAA